MKTSAPQGTQTPGTSPINYDPPTEEQKQEGERIKIDKIEKNPSGGTEISDKAVIRKAAQEAAGKEVIVQTELYGSNWKNCTLTLKNGQATVTKTSEVLYESTFSTCLGFSIPTSEFSASGTWQATLVAEKQNGAKVTSEAVDVTVKK